MVCVAIAAGCLVPSTVIAQESRDLVVSHTSVDLDRARMVVSVRCPKRSTCAGRLVAKTGDAQLTEARRIRVPSRQRARVALRLRPSALRTREETQGLEDRLVFRVGARAVVLDDVDFVPVPTCRAGRTLATSGSLRVFHLAGFGLYACASPTDRFLALGDLDTSTASNPVAAGRYVAVVGSSASSQCTLREVIVFDVPARSKVRSRRVTQYEPARDACSGPPPSVLALLPSGAVAWSEPPSDGTNALIRAVDSTGDRLLARGPTVDPASLAVADSTTVRWTDDGRTSTAALE